jgi:hypothetical protein
MGLIKLEYDNKIFRIPEPETFEELQSKIKAKFGKLEMQSHVVYYQDADNDEVRIERDSDLKVAFKSDSKIEKIFLKLIEESTMETPNALKNEELGRMFSYLNSLINHEKLKKVETYVDAGCIPCPRCLNNCSSVKPKKGNLCKNCQGTGKKPLTKIWSFVLFLIDCKVKEFLLDPVSDIVSEQNSIILKDDLLERNSTKFSYHTSEPADRKQISNCLKQNNAGSSFISPVDFFNNSVTWSGNKPINDLQSKFNDTTLLDRSSLDSNNFKKHKTFIAPTGNQKDKILAKNVNFSFPEYGQNESCNHEDERFFTKEQLQFNLLEGEAWLSTMNTIEVCLLIEGISNKSWPLGVHIRGKECEVTKGVNFALEKRVKASSIVGIKFNFSVKLDLTESLISEPLCFEFVATDLVKNIKYFSRSFKIPLKIKKNSKINICTRVR